MKKGKSWRSGWSRALSRCCRRCTHIRKERHAAHKLGGWVQGSLASRTSLNLNKGYARQSCAALRAGSRQRALAHLLDGHRGAHVVGGDEADVRHARGLGVAQPRRHQHVTHGHPRPLRGGDRPAAPRGAGRLGDLVHPCVVYERAVGVGGPTRLKTGI
jgi:hypothetical protein